MSWAQAIQRARALIEKRSDSAPVAADAGVPMGGSVGGLITFKVSPFIRAGNTLVPQPQSIEQIVSISRLRTQLQGAVHRLYTARGDGGQGNECFLQIYTDAAGEAQELVYFHRLLRMIPGSAEEQAAFLGEGDSGLGGSSFSLYKGQFEGLGLPEQLVATAFGDGDSLEYVRCVGDASQDFVKPFKGVENRIDDSMGQNGLRQDVVFMPYRRTLASGGEEQLLICTEVLKEQDGQTTRQIHVDFMVGLVLTKEGVTVQ